MFGNVHGNIIEFERITPFEVRKKVESKEKED